MATFVWTGATNANYSTGSNWQVGGVAQASPPTAADDVLLGTGTGATNNNCTVDAASVCRSIDCTSYTGTMTVNNTFTLSIGDASGGAATFVSGMTLTVVGSGSFQFVSTSTNGGAGWNVTTGGKDLRTANFNGAGGQWIFQDNYTSTSTLQLTTGTLSTNGKAVTVSTLNVSGTSTRVLDISNSTVTLTSIATANVVNLGTTGLTFTGTGSTIVISAASANTRTFIGNGKTFGTLTYTVAASPGTLALTGANTFITLNIGSGRAITPTAATTTTVSTFNVNGADYGYVRLPGISGNYLSAPDSAALDITSDITLLTRVALDTWNPAAVQYLIGKSNTSQRAYAFRVETNGRLGLLLTTDGSTLVTTTSSASPTVTDGAALWVLVSWRASDGRTQFFTASGATANPVASDFTQLGTDRSVVVASIFNSNQVLEIGTINGGTAISAGLNYYRAKIYNGVFSTAAFGGTLQFDADLVAKAVGADTFTEGSANAATVTVNGTAAKAGDGRVTLSSITAATHTLTSSNQQSCDYLSIDHSIVDASPKWYAGANSTDNGSNTNWVFTVPPATSTPRRLALLGVG